MVLKLLDSAVGLVVGTVAGGVVGAAHGFDTKGNILNLPEALINGLEGLAFGAGAGLVKGATEGISGIVSGVSDASQKYHDGKED